MPEYREIRFLTAPPTHTQLCAKLGYNLADSVPLPKHENLSKANFTDAEGSLGKNQKVPSEKNPTDSYNQQKTQPEQAAACSR